MRSSPLLLFVLCSLLPLSCRSTQANVQQRPNILFIYSDDHATAAVSSYGSVINRTPNIDRLAREGVLFENAFCTNGICAPSRAVVLTGLHSHLNGVLDNGGRFDGAQTTFPKLLQAAGYQTALIGKWHLKSDPTGFDHWEILPGQGHYYNPDMRDANGKARRDGYVTDVVTDLTLEWLENRDPNQPFLLMSQHKAPHRPWFAGPDHLDLYDGETIPEPATLFDDYATRCDAARNQEMSIAKHMYTYYDLKVPPTDPDAELAGADRWTDGLYERMSDEQRAAWHAAYDPRNEEFIAANLAGDELVCWKYQRYIKEYLRCIASVDDNIGRILDYLDESGLAENTIVIYSSDQGFYLGEHGWYDKRFMYEPSLRLPLVMRWPGVAQAGSRPTQLVQNLDIAPTLLSAAGVPVPAEMQGHDLRPIIAGDADDWRESIYYEYYERGIHAVEPHYGVRTDRYKLIHFPGLSAWELFDLQVDPDELNNIYDEPGVRAVQDQLTSELERLRTHYRVPAG